MCVSEVVGAAGVIAGGAITVASGGTLAPVGLAVAAGGLKVAGDIKGAQAQSDSLKRQASVDQKNADIAEQNAGFALADAEVKANQQEDRGVRAGAEAALAADAGGSDPGSGTGLQLTEDAERMGAHLANMARLEGARLAYGYKSQGLQFRQSAQAKRQTADDVIEAGWWKAGGDVIGSAAQAYGMDKSLSGSKAAGAAADPSMMGGP